jgi:hypothetical protein
MVYNANRKRGELMIKEKYEVKEHVVVDRVLIGQQMFCDVCGKEIKHKQYYWKVNIGHTDYDGYDNNSFDICSVECLKQKFSDFCEYSKNDYYYEIDAECNLWMPKENVK